MGATAPPDARTTCCGRSLLAACCDCHVTHHPLLPLVSQIPDEGNTLMAGAATGMLYRSVRGPKQAAAAAVVGTAGAAALLAARKFINPGL